MPASSISCPGCGTKYAWKPQLAGKKVKCKCGTSFRATDPAGAAAAAAAAGQEEGFDIVDDAPAAVGCPSCGAAMAPGAVLCVTCGYNLKTGQHMPTAAVPAAAVPAGAAAAAPVASSGARGTVVDPSRFAAAYPTHRARIQPESDEQESSGARRMVIPILVLLLVVGGAVGGGIMLSQRGSSGATGTQLGDDPNIVAMMNDEGATEINEWLQSPRNMVMGMTDNQAQNRAKQWYDMGAKKVFAFGAGMTMSLGIELPDEPEKRKAIFDWQATWHREMFEKVATDVGQKYLLIKMRL